MRRDKRKLSLSRETVRQLDKAQQAQVVGGLPTDHGPTVRTACYTYCNTCECAQSYTPATGCNTQGTPSFCVVC